jgi:uncharacterized protein YabE (DUF348 family)
MVGSKLQGWFKELSTIAKIGVVSGTGIALLTATGVIAGSPTVTYKNVTVTEAVQYSTTLQDDDTMLTTDPHKVLTAGVEGSKQVTYKVKYENDKKTDSKQFVKEVITKQAVAQVEAVGTKEVVSETANEAVPFGSTTILDSSMTKGTSKVSTAGVNGQKTVTYQVTKIKGVEVSRVKTGEEVTTQPITQVTSIGTKVAVRTSSNCDPNYSGGCVPIASDVDCGGGSGNGPAYFYGTATVVGYDIYGLDRDGDGIACE